LVAAVGGGVLQLEGTRLFGQHRTTELGNWDLVRAESIAGILYRSTRDATQRCLVLFPEFAGQFTAAVYDPDGMLPQNADSWRNPR
jgi:hypothetical protein